MSERWHGAANGYSYHACRCSACTEANRNKQADFRQRMRAMPTPPHVHHSTNGYQNYGCRCRDCTAANTIAKRKQRERAA